MNGGRRKWWGAEEHPSVRLLRLFIASNVGGIEIYLESKMNPGRKGGLMARELESGALVKSYQPA
jgi:cbb3-type cytochrome oxidase subunit 1